MCSIAMLGSADPHTATITESSMQRLCFRPSTPALVTSSFIHSSSHSFIQSVIQCYLLRISASGSPLPGNKIARQPPPTHSKTPTLWRFHCSVRTVYRGGDIDPKCEGGSELPNSPRGLAEKWICPKAQEGREKMGGMKAPVPCPLVGQTPHL